MGTQTRNYGQTKNGSKIVHTRSALTVLIFLVPNDLGQIWFIVHSVGVLSSLNPLNLGCLKLNSSARWRYCHVDYFADKFWFNPYYPPLVGFALARAGVSDWSTSTQNVETNTLKHSCRSHLLFRELRNSLFLARGTFHIQLLLK
jgi:hypothetical protein